MHFYFNHLIFHYTVHVRCANSITTANIISTQKQNKLHKHSASAWPIVLESSPIPHVHRPHVRTHSFEYTKEDMFEQQQADRGKENRLKFLDAHVSSHRASERKKGTLKDTRKH